MRDWSDFVEITRGALLAVAALSLSVAGWAQHGAHVGSGSFAGHGGASGGHSLGSPAARSSRVMSAPAGAAGIRTGRTSVRPQQEGNWTSSGFIPSRNGAGRQSYNHDRRVGYAYAGYPFVYPFAYINGGLDLDDNDPNDPNAQAPAGNAYADNNSPEQAYAAQPDSYPRYRVQDSARPPYNPTGYGNNEENISSGKAAAQSRVTLIFKDGRQPLEIENYAMTQTKLFVSDNGRERDIAISDLDVPATISANDQAGVEFTLPVSR